MDKEINEMAEVLKDSVCNNILKFGNVVALEELAEALYNAGYHKTVWHKVADGDLPKFINDLVIAIKCNDGAIRTVAGNYRLERFNISDLGEIDLDDVIAWTELPKYEGEE